jgi:hypothetical protein
MESKRGLMGEQLKFASSLARLDLIQINFSVAGGNSFRSLSQNCELHLYLRRFGGAIILRCNLGGAVMTGRAISWLNAPMTLTTDDIMAAGLRLLWELDAFLAVGTNRLDEIAEADRNNLHAALSAASTALAATHPPRKNEREPG